MFNYPLSIPRGSDYELLGVGPEADRQEISEAQMELKRRWSAEQDQLRARLDAVYKRIDGLRGADTRLAALQVERGDAARATARAAQVELVRLEHEAEKIEPEFKQLRERVRQFDKSIADLNQLKIVRAADRPEYDRSNPPFELLKLTDPTRDAYSSDQRVALALVRRELAEFLRQQNEEVFHPSDLTRDDFSGDFTYLELLDGPRS
ncbi:MAG TPA: hypothetical protein VHV55_17085 [Pirellulales bacterium]|jgi:hypothetical protein|nr:hypothetical protein [Pirellulales bacterium]